MVVCRNRHEHRVRAKAFIHLSIVPLLSRSEYIAMLAICSVRATNPWETDCFLILVKPLTGLIENDSASLLVEVVAAEQRCRALRVVLRHQKNGLLFTD